MQWLNLSDNVNALALLGAAVILILTVVIFGLYLKKIKDMKSEGEAIDHSWDGIGEYTNDIPIGWVACFIGVLIWAFWYFFVGYPLKSFSQIGQYNAEVQEHNATYASKWDNLDSNELKEMGKGIFLVQCVECHGPNADGMDNKAQNLTAWGKEEGIIRTIKMGSKGLLNDDGDEMEMAALDYIDDKDAKAVAAYIMQELSALKKTKNPELVGQGKEVYAENCASCHYEDGKGKIDGTMMGADLTKYGSQTFLQEVLRNGKRGNIGIMPSYDYANFAPKQIEALNIFIQSLESE